jgi:hypothetical protein
MKTPFVTGAPPDGGRRDEGVHAYSDRCARAAAELELGGEVDLAMRWKSEAGTVHQPSGTSW